MKQVDKVLGQCLAKQVVKVLLGQCLVKQVVKVLGQCLVKQVVKVRGQSQLDVQAHHDIVTVTMTMMYVVCYWQLFNLVFILKSHIIQHISHIFGVFFAYPYTVVFGGIRIKN